jgi:hypothetical protein
MLEEFLEHPFFLNRHRQAPLLKERESFLSHLQQQGTSRKALRNLSGELLQVVRLLKLTEMRDVSLAEIRQAARCWAREQRTNPGAFIRQLRVILYICVYMRRRSGCDSMDGSSCRARRLCGLPVSFATSPDT